MKFEVIFTSKPAVIVQVENTIKTTKAFSEGGTMKRDFAENEISFLQNSFFQELDFIVSHFSDIIKLSQL